MTYFVLVDKLLRILITFTAEHLHKAYLGEHIHITRNLGIQIQLYTNHRTVIGIYFIFSKIISFIYKFERKEKKVKGRESVSLCESERNKERGRGRGREDPKIKEKLCSSRWDLNHYRMTCLLGKYLELYLFTITNGLFIKLYQTMQPLNWPINKQQ